MILRFLLFFSFIFFFLFLLGVAFSGDAAAAYPCKSGETSEGVVPVSNCGWNVPEAVCCTSGQEAYCFGKPWTAVDYQCHKCKKTFTGGFYRFSYVRVVRKIWTCYTTDICYRRGAGGVTGAKIIPGICRRPGLGVSCTTGGWYKTCCQNDRGSFGTCGITRPYARSCSRGFVVPWNSGSIDFRTCKSKIPPKPPPKPSADIRANNRNSLTVKYRTAITISWTSRYADRC